MKKILINKNTQSLTQFDKLFRTFYFLASSLTQELTSTKYTSKRTPYQNRYYLLKYYLNLSHIDVIVWKYDLFYDFQKDREVFVGRDTIIQADLLPNKSIIMRTESRDLKIFNLTNESFIHFPYPLGSISSWIAVENKLVFIHQREIIVSDFNLTKRLTSKPFPQRPQLIQHLSGNLYIISFETQIGIWDILTQHIEYYTVDMDIYRIKSILVIDNIVIFSNYAGRCLLWDWKLTKTTGTLTYVYGLAILPNKQILFSRPPELLSYDPLLNLSTPIRLFFDPVKQIKVLSNEKIVLSSDTHMYIFNLPLNRIEYTRSYISDVTSKTVLSNGLIALGKLGGHFEIYDPEKGLTIYSGRCGNRQIIDILELDNRQILVLPISHEASIYNY